MDSVEAARDLIPSYIRCANTVLCPLAATLVTALAMGLALRLTRPRLSPEAHWAERAGEFSSGTLLLSQTALACWIGAILPATMVAGPLGCVDRLGMFGILALAVWLVTVRVSGTNLLRHMDWLDRRKLWRGFFGWFLFFRLPWLPALLTFTLLPATPGPVFFAILVPGAALFLFAELGGGLSLARWVGLARPAPDRVKRAVERVAAGSPRPSPSVLTVEMAMANACALPLQTTVCFTERAVETLTDEEMERIAAHEMSHVNEPRIDTAKRLLSAPLGLVFMVARPALAQGYRSWFLVALAAAAYLWIRSRRTTLRLERSADEDARAGGEDAEVVYARALEKLHRDNLAPPVAGLALQPHPELYDRLTSAGVTPDYPRPEPSRTPYRKTLAVVASILALYAGLVALGLELMRRSPESETVTLTAIAVTGGDAPCLLDLARHRLDRDRPGDAVTFLRAAAALDRAEPVYRIYLAEALCREGRIVEARYELDLALVQLAARPDPDLWVLGLYNSTELSIEIREAE